MNNNALTLYVYLKEIFREYKLYFIALFFVSVIAAVFQVAVTYKIKEIIDTIAASVNTPVGGLLALSYIL